MILGILKILGEYYEVQCYYIDKIENFKLFNIAKRVKQCNLITEGKFSLCGMTFLKSFNDQEIFFFSMTKKC